MDKLKKQITEALAQEAQVSRSADKVKFGWLGAWLVPMAFGMIKTATAEIKDPTAREFVDFAVEEVEGIIALLTDADKDNKLQIWEYYERNWKEKVKRLIPAIVRIVNAKMPDNATRKVILSGLEQILVNI